jgi:transcriptional regulator GlxA family with amidase domain
MLMKSKPGPRQIAIVVPPNTQLLDVSGPMDAFLEANRQSGGAADYELYLVSTSTDKIVRAGSTSLMADASIFDEDRRIDTLLVMGTPDYAFAYESVDLHAWLRRRAQLTRRCGSVGTGAFFLGAAGLLDGMSATTHWQHTAELAERCPTARILADHIYVEDGKLHTSAGVTAGIDLALKLIEEDCGRELARRVARNLVVSCQNFGERRQFSTYLTVRSRNEDRVQAVQHWILDHLSLDLTLKTLASRTAMGVRHFSRVFQQETGSTPGEFVEIARLDAARRLLENSDMMLKDIASRCGFANSDVMSRAFQRKMGTRPRVYRHGLRD